MFGSRIRAAGVALVAGLSLGACTYGNGYGYSGLSIGFGTGGYYDDYYDPYYGGDPYGRSYSPYYGWYDGFYYPGTGYYVYDRYRRPHRWNDYQRGYWENRRHAYRGYMRGRPHGFRQNWRDFRRDRRYRGY